MNSGPLMNSEGVRLGTKGYKVGASSAAHLGVNCIKRLCPLTLEMTHGSQNRSRMWTWADLSSCCLTDDSVPPLTAKVIRQISVQMLLLCAVSVVIPLWGINIPTSVLSRPFSLTRCWKPYLLFSFCLFLFGLRTPEKQNRINVGSVIQ